MPVSIHVLTMLGKNLPMIDSKVKGIIQYAENPRSCNRFTIAIIVTTAMPTIITITTETDELAGSNSIKMIYAKSIHTQSN